MEAVWQDPRGLIQKLKARCLDLSEEGARLETDSPVPARTRITINCLPFGSLGMASVRTCQRHSLKYWIGVEFTSSLALAVAARKRCLEEIQRLAESQA